VAECLAADEKLQRLDVSPEQLVRKAQRLGELTGAGVYRSLLRAYVPSDGGARPGDKDPRMVEHLGLLHRIFPDAHCVHVIRDPRDVLASKKAAEWSRNRHVLRHALAGHVQLRAGRREGRRHFGDRYVEVFYEDVLRDPETALRQLCWGVGMPYDAAMLEFRQAAASLVAPEEMQWKAETLGPLLTGNVDKWRSVLTPAEALLAEKASREAMLAGGYAPSGSEHRPGWPARAAVGLVAGALAAAGSVYAVGLRLRDAIARG
jgi:hypothetical protein